MPQPIADAWNQVLAILAKLIIPDWGDPIHWLPLIFSGLVVLVFALILARWASMAAINRPRVPRPIAAGAPPPGVHMPGPSPWPFFLPIGLAIVLFSLVIHGSGEHVNPPLLLVGLLVTLAVLAGWIRDAMADWRRVENLAAHGAATTGAHAMVAGPATGAAALPSGSWVLPRVAPRPAAELEAGTDHALPPGVHLPGPSPWPFFLPVGAFFLLFGLVMNPAILFGGLLMTLIALAGWFLDAGREFRQVDAGHAPEPRTRDPRRAFPDALVATYGLIAVASVALAFAPSFIGALNATPAPAGGGAVASAAAGGGVPSSELHVTAQNVKFDQTTLTAPAGQPFTIVFDNKDAVPHNIAIFDSSKLTTLFFRGKIFTGPGSQTYSVPALQPGTYYFHCDVHPTTMNGTLVVK